MTFCQLAHADSLREICNGLACSEGKLVHLGAQRAPNKSTLAYAKEHRPAALFEDLFYTSLNRFRGQQGLGTRKSKFRFKNKLLSLDSTTISLCLELYPWAKYRRAKGGVKAHVLLDHDDYLPSYVLITEAKQSDVRVAQSLDLNAGSIVAMDRGYNDYALFGKWTGQGVFFVTRLKDKAVYEVTESIIGPLPHNIRSDQTIRLTGQQAIKDCPHLLRRVVVWDEKNQREIDLLTNQRQFGPTTIAAIYKDRWQIGVSRQGHIVQPVKDRPRPTDSGLVAWEAPWRENKTVEPSDNMLRKEYARRTRLQCKVNADVASLHEIPVAQTVDNARKQKSWPKRVRCGSSHRRGISGDMV